MHDGPPTLDLAWLFAQLVMRPKGIQEGRIIGISVLNDAKDLDLGSMRNLQDTDPGLPLRRSHGPCPYLASGFIGRISSARPSPRPLDVIEADQPVLRIEDHSDRVEADRVGGWPDVLLLV